MKLSTSLFFILLAYSLPGYSSCVERYDEQILQLENSNEGLEGLPISLGLGTLGTAFSKRGPVKACFRRLRAATENIDVKSIKKSRTFAATPILVTGGSATALVALRSGSTNAYAQQLYLTKVSLEQLERTGSLSGTPLYRRLWEKISKHYSEQKAYDILDQQLPEIDRFVEKQNSTQRLCQENSHHARAERMPEYRMLTVMGLRDLIFKAIPSLSEFL